MDFNELVDFAALVVVVIGVPFIIMGISHRDDAQTHISVSIESNIAAGKSAFLEKLVAGDDTIECVPRTAAVWTHIMGLPHHNQTHFDVSAMMTSLYDKIRMSLVKHSDRATVTIYERSIDTDINCFGPYSYLKGYLSKQEGIIYTLIAEKLKQSLPDISGYIYLRVSPTTCYQKMLLRARPEESSITLSDVMWLHESHNTWLEDESRVHPVLIVDDDSPASIDRAKKFIQDLRASTRASTRATSLSITL